MGRGHFPSQLIEWGGVIAGARGAYEPLCPRGEHEEADRRDEAEHLREGAERRAISEVRASVPDSEHAELDHEARGLRGVSVRKVVHDDSGREVGECLERVGVRPLCARCEVAQENLLDARSVGIEPFAKLLDASGGGDGEPDVAEEGYGEEAPERDGHVEAPTSTSWIGSANEWVAAPTLR